jgi:hypothetical protein
MYILQFALDIPSLFTDNTPQQIKAMTEESTSVEAARDGGALAETPPGRS